MPRTQGTKHWMLQRDHSRQVTDHLRPLLPRLVNLFPQGLRLLREVSLEVRTMRGISSTTCILIRGLTRQLEKSAVVMKDPILTVFAIPEIKLGQISNSLRIL